MQQLAARQNMENAAVIILLDFAIHLPPAVKTFLQHLIFRSARSCLKIVRVSK